MSFKLALIQLRVEGGRPSENLNRAAQLTARAAADGADVVLLPEALDFGWCHTSAIQGAGTVPDGNSCERLRAAAK